ncbi:hypothetical protein [Streptomyces sp. NPDC014006]|uniref:hypothetical protein n=1 Tax=Streptomyces sp. NPDC014006 TaxID=3364870 RepID=UPI0036F84ACD
MAPAGVGRRLGEVAGDEDALDPLDQRAQLVVVLRGVEQEDERRVLPLVLGLRLFLEAVAVLGRVSEGLAGLRAGALAQRLDQGGEAGHGRLEVLNVLEQADGDVEVGFIGHGGLPSSRRRRRRRAW